MPRAAKPLTATATGIRNAKPDDLPLWDGAGPLLIRRGEVLHWRLKYRRPDGRENRLALGLLSEVSLAEARTFRDQARTVLRNGTDPADARKAQREQSEQALRGTVAAACADWIEFKRSGWSS